MLDIKVAGTTKEKMQTLWNHIDKFIDGNPDYRHAQMTLSINRALRIPVHKDDPLFVHVSSLQELEELLKNIVDKEDLEKYR